jgi:hypothetical protein
VKNYLQLNQRDEQKMIADNEKVYQNRSGEIGRDYVEEI